MADITRCALRYAMYLGAATLRKKPKKTVSDKNAPLLLLSLSSANNAATPTKSPTLLPVTPYKAKPVARDPVIASNSTSTTPLGLPP